MQLIDKFYNVTLNDFVGKKFECARCLFSYIVEKNDIMTKEIFHCNFFQYANYTNNLLKNIKFRQSTIKLVCPNCGHINNFNLYCDENNIIDNFSIYNLKVDQAK